MTRAAGPIGVVVTLALAACAAPASYDGLSGGAKHDPMLVAPRQLSPISVSTVATSRPRFKWDLTQTATGAVLELCRKRDCLPSPEKKYVTEGRELVVPEDLEPGIWFWRLRSRAGARVGTQYGPTWEVLVRGPAKYGSSDAPTGSVVDIDGDGAPDLFVAGYEHADPRAAGDEPAQYPLLFQVRGLPGGELSRLDPSAIPQMTFYAMPMIGDVAIGGGVDLDGDGFTDVVHAGMDAMPVAEGDLYSTLVEYGSPTGFDANKSSTLPFMDFSSFYPGILPILREAGDVNGDGYGDVVAGGDDLGFVTFGTRQGPSAVLPIAGAPPGVKSRAVISGFDADGDGLADVAIAAPRYTPDAAHASGAKLAAARSDPETSKHSQKRGVDDAIDPHFLQMGAAFAARGSADMKINDGRGLVSALSSSSSSEEHVATAFASGDFNGDGVADMAATISSLGGSTICVWFGSRDSFMVQGPCARSLPGDTRFGGDITAADLEGDGVDELLVTAVNGGRESVRVVTVAVDGAAARVAPIGPAGVGGRLTTIWPGRPGKARWAAIAANGRALAVFEGDELRQTLDAPAFVEKLGTGLR